LYQSYAQTIGIDPAAEVEAARQHFFDEQAEGKKFDHKPKLSKLPEFWSPYRGGEILVEDEVKTGIPAERVLELSKLSNAYPAEFHIHPKVQKLYEQRLKMAEGQ